MVLISPSIMSADFGKLEDEIKKLENANANSIHVDVMDGHFVPNLTFGPVLIKAIKKLTKLPLDVHLMITNAEEIIDSYIDTGADMITIHQEACRHPHRLLSYVQSKKIKAGIALNPSTSERSLEYVLDVIDMVLIMSVNPGFGGQSFIHSAIKKIGSVKKIFNEAKKNDCLIAVDGGINAQTAPLCINAGANMLVCGSYLFSSPDYKKTILGLKA